MPDIRDKIITLAKLELYHRYRMMPRWRALNHTIETTIKYVVQTLTNEQKAQARTNIDAAANTAMTGATAQAAGTAGLVPGPTAGSDTRFLCSDGTWAEAVTLADAQTISGVKTFSNSPLAPTPQTSDDSQAVATTAWVRNYMATIANFETVTF